jgi:hypothetical protein
LNSASINEGNLIRDNLIKGVYVWGKHVERGSVQSFERYSSKHENELFTILCGSETKYKLEIFYYNLGIIYYNGTIKSRCMKTDFGAVLVYFVFQCVLFWFDCHKLDSPLYKITIN